MPGSQIRRFRTSRYRIFSLRVFPTFLLDWPNLTVNPPWTRNPSLKANRRVQHACEPPQADDPTGIHLAHWRIRRFATKRLAPALFGTATFSTATPLGTAGQPMASNWELLWKNRSIFLSPREFCGGQRH